MMFHRAANFAFLRAVYEIQNFVSNASSQQFLCFLVNACNTDFLHEVALFYHQEAELRRPNVFIATGPADANEEHPDDQEFHGEACKKKECSVNFFLDLRCVRAGVSANTINIVSDKSLASRAECAL